MPKLVGTLDLPRCPHCAVANPNLRQSWSCETNNSSASLYRRWVIYVCSTCGGVVSAWARSMGEEVKEHFPEVGAVSELMPDRTRAFLSQAKECLHAPAGAVMLAASAVDAMLKERGLSEGKLYARIEKATQEHLITKEMAEWAHAVRLEANDQRHADDAASLPTIDDAQKCIDFATALGEILFVLPARVERGLKGDRN